MDPRPSPAEIPDDDPFLKRHFPGTSDAIVKVRQLVARLNTAKSLGLIRAILIRGESGAGKNRLARVIAGHRRWLQVRNSKDAPDLECGLDAFTDLFGEIHLPSLPEPLIEGELFGHKKGAYTGAQRDRPGLLAGNRNEILLDEVGDATASLQTKLLAVVDHGRYRPVGGGFEDDDETSARLILATNQNLEALVEQGKFRFDLYARVLGFVITVPPLRAQPENIPDILGYVHNELTTDWPALESAPMLRPEDLAWAKTYHWPFNVRQMRHALKMWLFEDGSLSLEEIVMRSNREMTLGQQRQDTASIKALVRERLHGALHRGMPCPGSLGALQDEFADQVRAAIREWYTETKPPKEDLKHLFPDMGIESIQNKMSQFGRPNRREET